MTTLIFEGVLSVKSVEDKNNELIKISLLPKQIDALVAKSKLIIGRLPQDINNFELAFRNIKGAPACIISEIDLDRKIKDRKNSKKHAHISWGTHNCYYLLCSLRDSISYMKDGIGEILLAKTRGEILDVLKKSKITSAKYAEIKEERHPDWIAPWMLRSYKEGIPLMEKSGSVLISPASDVGKDGGNDDKLGNG